MHVLSFATHASELLYSTAEESKPGTVIGHLTKRYRDGHSNANSKGHANNLGI